MSRVLSFRDILRIPEFKDYNEIGLLHPSMDSRVNFYLGQLGFDLDYAIVYEPSKHRDMAGKVAVGFRAIGEISINNAFIGSRLATFEDRMMAAYNKDPGLARELANLGGNSVSFKSAEIENSAEDEEFPDTLIEPDYEEVAREIRNLEKIRDAIRVDVRDESGSFKLPVVQ